MNVLIIENELQTALQLEKLLVAVDPAIEVISILGSVSSAVSSIPTYDEIDLIFAEVYLSDGLSFEIYRTLHIEVPVVFCTAYDPVVPASLELHDLDYLLKPVGKDDLERSLEKYGKLRGNGPESTINPSETTRKILALYGKMPGYNNTRI